MSRRPAIPWLSVALCMMASLSLMRSAQAATDKPNILVIFGDDVGQTDISAYSMGVMGFHTPNIDRVAKEGMLFTDYYAENSCTAGRSSFITGQSPFRTGLSKVGVPGAPVGLQARDITIAQALKPLGYATGQFGKNHLGDRDEFLPSNHGFDEFFLQTFIGYPPSQAPASFSIDQIEDAVKKRIAQLEAQAQHAGTVKD